MMQVEFRRKSFFESLRAGVARVDERAVNVEQNQSCHARKISEPPAPARFLGWSVKNKFETTRFDGSFQLRKGEMREKLEAGLKD
jgi:hypothetical protein